MPRAAKLGYWPKMKSIGRKSCVKPGVVRLILTQQLRQLGDIHRDPSRLIFAEQLGSGSPPWLVLEIDIRELLPGRRQSQQSRRLVLQQTKAAGSGGFRQSRLLVCICEVE